MEEQAVIEQIEATVESVVPEVVETVNAVRNNPIVLAGVALVGLSVGVVVGFKVAEKRLGLKYDALMQEEIEKTQRFYAATTKADYPTIDDAVEALVPEAAGQAMVNYGAFAGNVPEIVDDESEVIVVEAESTVQHRNIFVNGKPMDEEFDYEAEVAQRSDDHPFIVSEDEFFENEGDFEVSNFTYWAGDDVLVDEKDNVVNETNTLVGDDNLQRFGHGSKDRNTVYIRNTKLEQAFEIVRSEGKYSVEVLGFDDEEHRHAPARRFRGSDD